MKTIIKEYTVYDIDDLKKDDDLCNDIYQKFWLDDPNNINPWADENIDSFENFALVCVPNELSQCSET